MNTTVDQLKVEAADIDWGMSPEEVCEMFHIRPEQLEAMILSIDWDAILDDGKPALHSRIWRKVKKTPRATYDHIKNLFYRAEEGCNHLLDIIEEALSKLINPETRLGEFIITSLTVFSWIFLCCLVYMAICIVVFTGLAALGLLV